VALARKARERETGARALRGILETLMLPYDLDIPSQPNVAGIRVTADFVNGRAEPLILRRPQVAQA
jgi:ATP-dependent Clp protease ATP-binding subunit ClpX